MNAAIQRALPPAVPGAAPVRMRDKAEAVDTSPSFAAALDTFAESLAAVATPLPDALAHRGKAEPHGKLPPVHDEPASEVLTMMLAAAAAPLVPVRGPAPAEGAGAHDVLSVGRPKQPIARSAGPVAALAAMSRPGAAVPPATGAARDARDARDAQDASPADAGRLASAASRAVPSGELARPRDLVPARAGADASSDRRVAASVPPGPPNAVDRTAEPRPTAAAAPPIRALPATQAKLATGGSAGAAAAAPPDGPLLPAQPQVQEMTALASGTPGKQAEEASADAPGPLASLPGLATPGPHIFVPAAPESAPVQVGAAVGSSDWGEGLGQHLVRLASPGRREVELNLNPAELGPLRVSLSLTDHHAQIAFVSEHPAVRAALEAALPQLRTTFADSGISLGHTSVGSGSGEPRPENGPANHRPDQAEPARFDAAPPKPPRPAAAGQDAGSGIDTFA